MFLIVKILVLVIELISKKYITLYELLSLIVAICGFGAVVVSIYLLTRQTKYLVRSVEGDTYASVTTNLTITKQLFIEHPELRRYFYLGDQISKADINYPRALCVAEHLLDFFDGILLQKKPPLWPAHLWKKYMLDSFERSPILREYLQGNSGWYTRGLSDLMDEAMGKPPTREESKAKPSLARRLASVIQRSPHHFVQRK